MRKPNEIVNLPLSNLLDIAEEVGKDVVAANIEVDQIASELNAATSYFNSVKREADIITSFTQAMLKHNGNAEKQEQVKTKFEARLAKNYLVQQQASESLKQSRNAVREALEALPNQLMELTQAAVLSVADKNKNQPEPVILDKSAIAGTIS